jgi:hypothetical protein
VELVVLGNEDVAHPAAGVQRNDPKARCLAHRTVYGRVSGSRIRVDLRARHIGPGCGPIGM